jgi:hypothetical protein
VSTCLSCRAPVVWGITGAGKRIPVDPDPVADGNLAIGPETPPRVRYLQPNEDPVRTSEWRGVSHFATCPDAKLHRKSR